MQSHWTIAHSLNRVKSQQNGTACSSGAENKNLNITYFGELVGPNMSEFFIKHNTALLWLFANTTPPDTYEDAGQQMFPLPHPSIVRTILSDKC